MMMMTMVRMNTVSDRGCHSEMNILTATVMMMMVWLTTKMGDDDHHHRHATKTCWRTAAQFLLALMVKSLANKAYGVHVLPTLGPLMTSNMRDYDDDGDMHVLGAGARGVDDNQRKTRAINKQREKHMIGPIQSSRINPYQSPFIKNEFIIHHHPSSLLNISHHSSTFIINHIQHIHH